MKSPFLLLSIFGMLFSCSTKQKEIIIPQVEIVEPQEKFDSYLIENLNSVLKKNNFSDKNRIEQFYKKNNYKAVWLTDSLNLNVLGDSLYRIINHANYYGLESRDYKFQQLQKIVKQLKEKKTSDILNEDVTLLEIILSDSYMLFGKHLNFGKIENIDSLSTLKRKLFSIDLPNYYANAVAKDSVLERLFDLQPQHKAYEYLQKSLQSYLKQASFSSNEIKVSSFRVDSLNAYNQARKVLELHKYISQNASDSIFINGLKKFQVSHGLTADGVVGRNTAKALSKSPLEYYQNAAVSLERWRWKNRWNSSYIYVNIPSYSLEYFKNDSLLSKHNVVVGSVKNKTLEIYSKLNHLVAYPYWNVPTSISVKEILVKVKKDSSYMKKNNYEIFSNKFKKMNLDSIKWDTIHKKNFHYYIRQKGGVSNSLGLVKFKFYNKYSIYLHDTPTKRHFYLDIRAKSHGCVRVQNALKLTDEILKYDKNIFTLDTVYAYIKKKEEKTMRLTNKLPIYIHYITCVGNKDNELTFYKDIYGYDEKVRKELFD
ncbi:MAG: L,D-transpeptidase family protein [Flavobacteriaceae bacterium]|nr:L,D-transpeptidase family protein [Flavobacteriaceae bacterium]